MAPRQPNKTPPPNYNRLASEVLGRTLDELPPQSRKLLQLIADWVSTQSKQQQIDTKDYRFSRKDIREVTGWGNTQLKVHLRRLEDMEYLLVHRGGRGQSYVHDNYFVRAPGTEGAGVWVHNCPRDAAKNVAQFERLRSSLAADEILKAERIGNALKTVPFHRAASFVSKKLLAAGRVFENISGDGTRQTLLQAKGNVNGKSGIFEFLLTAEGKVNHQRFIRGGKINGIVNQDWKKK